LGPGEPYWGNGYTREAVAVVIEYGLRSLGMATIRAYTDPSNRALQKNSIAMRPQKRSAKSNLRSPPVTAHRMHLCSASRSRRPHDERHDVAIALRDFAPIA
jgi:hypothetical protein